jgi:hypothetical protein
MMANVSFCATGAEIFNVQERPLPPLVTAVQFGEAGVRANTCRTAPDGVTAIDWVAVEMYCGLRAVLDGFTLGTTMVIVAELSIFAPDAAWWAGVIPAPPPAHPARRAVMVKRMIVCFIA